MLPAGQEFVNNVYIVFPVVAAGTNAPPWHRAAVLFAPPFNQVMAASMVLRGLEGSVPAEESLPATQFVAAPV